ncbi:uncharacterized protein LOC134234754 [Saccostrea cucullata]|uniref:uncharacterized protein LOC134234754 n=1 Tax=Saccostrea cuccullata TaxID=36930 RepID=UPI002ED417A1
MDIMEVVKKPLYIMKRLDRMKSGSTREGFRLITSDEDWMFWPPDHKVICNSSQISLYRIPQHTVILMECDDLPPGLTRLSLLSQSNNAETVSSCVVMNDNIYVSSKIFRENYMRFLNSYDISTAVLHGPCSTYSILQNADTDNAFCFKSHHWQTSALPWIQRCRERGWPNQTVV